VLFSHFLLIHFSLCNRSLLANNKQLRCFSRKQALRLQPKFSIVAILLVDAKLVGVTGKACNKGFILEEI